MPWVDILPIVFIYLLTHYYIEKERKTKFNNAFGEFHSTLYKTSVSIFLGVVEISVGEVNNNLQFKNSNYSTKIQEHADLYTRVIQVELTSSPNPITFNFASGNQNGAFAINNNGKYSFTRVD